MVYRHGILHGILLMYTWTGVLGVYFFSIALVNHNSKHCHNIVARNKSQDWGEAQVHTCADWDVRFGSFGFFIFLMLNLHTVHHLFPRVDCSHLPSIQAIFVKTCQDYHIPYKAGTFLNLYKEMIMTFATPESLNETIFVYPGGKCITDNE